MGLEFYMAEDLGYWTVMTDFCSAVASQITAFFYEPIENPQNLLRFRMSNT